MGSSEPSGGLFGRIALKKGLVGEADLRRALRYQEELRALGLDRPLGRILVAEGVLAEGQVELILRLQELNVRARQGKAFARVAAKNGLVPQAVLDAALRQARDEGFARTLEATAAGEEFVFFEGPPTANNTPHVGHVVTRVVKDLFPRYQTMRGRHVRRKAGWDTHGLAVEIEVEKRLGLSGKKDIEQLVPGDRAASIAKFNRACLDSVMTYEAQWRVMSERFGYWIDMDDAYFTYSNRYVESVWSALRRLHERGLLYEGHKSQPYCARCGTTLSSHEVAQNYKDTEDPSIWVLFPVRPGQRLRTAEGADFETGAGLHLVAWTTTPWTMPGHAGMSAHPDLLYRLVELPDRPGVRLLFADAIEATIPLDVERDGKRERIDLRSLPAVAKFRGRDLLGLRYDRPYRTAPADTAAETKAFDAAPSDEAGWPVVLADYVTATDGTGLVHTAPAFGADDHRTGLEFGLPLFRTVEPNGRIAERRVDERDVIGGHRDLPGQHVELGERLPGLVRLAGNRVGMSEPRACS